MGCGCQREQRDGRPRVGGEDDAEVRHKKNGDDQQGADEQGILSPCIYSVSAFNDKAREPTAADGSHGGNTIDDDQRVLGVVEVQAVVVVQEHREIEEIEPPDGIGESLAEGEGIEATAAQESGVGKGLSVRGVGGKIGVQIGLGLSGTAAQAVVWEDEPDDAPENAHGSGADKGSVPAETGGDGGDENWSDKEGGAGAGVEYPVGQCTLFRGEPLSGGLDGGGEVAALAEAEEDSGDAEADHAGDDGVAEGGACPDGDGASVTHLGAQLVDDASGEEKADAVGDHEAFDDVGIVEVIGDLELRQHAWNPTHEGNVQERLDQPERGAVHVVDGGGGKEQGADKPTEV